MKNRFVQVVVLTAAVIVCAAVCRQVFAQAEPLRGTVVNKTDNPIKNVEVVLRAPATAEVIDEQVTGEDGAFTFPMESVRPGYELTFHKDGYTDVTLPISAQQLVVANLSVVMQPKMVVPSSRPAGATPTPTPTPAPAPSLVTPEARKRAIELYNKGVAAWEKAKSASDAEEDREKQAAIQMIRQSASLDPTFAEPLIMLSRLAMKSQNWAEASRYSEDLIRIDPNDVEAVRTLYFSMVIMRHHLRIGDAARRLAKIDPSTIPSIEEHAQTFFNNGLYLMARAMYEALTVISPDPANAYLHLGLSCAVLDDIDGTRAAFEAFLERAPADHPDIETVRQDLAALDAPVIPEALESQQPVGPIK